MTFSCEREIFSEALLNVSRIITQHATMDILKGIMLEARDGTLRVTATNLDNSIVISLEADITEEGSCVLESKLLCDIIRRLGGDCVDFRMDKQFQVVITSNLSEYNLIALPADKYPSLPEVTGLRSFTLTQPELKKHLYRTTYAVSTNENKQIHNGVLFEAENGCLTFVALDGYRLAMSTQSIGTNDSFSFVVPAEPLQIIERMLSPDGEMTVALHVGTRHVMLEMENTVAVARLLEGEFLKYRNSIPKNPAFSFAVNPKEFLSAVESISILIDEKLKNPVRIKFESGNMQLSCVTAKGRGFERVDIKGGGELEMGFNNRYLLDALRHVAEDEITVECTNTLTAIKIYPVDNDDYLFLVLPVRLKAE